jgi:glycosyl hydrolase family 106( putative alpha-L-rhamnosidase)
VRPRFSRVLLPALLLARVALGQAADLAWPETTPEAKPWTRWWWMGSAVDRENLTAELETLAAAGIGGVEVTSIYGVRGYEHAFVPYLSDRWIDLLLHAAAEARRRGMGLDMPPGSGWRLGGPSVRLEDAVASLRIEVDTVRGAYVATVRPAGDKVKRAAPGGEGNALDPFSRVAVRRYLEAYGDRITTVPRGTVRAFFHDSFEYTGNASPELFDEFLRRRGYDLKGYLPALRGEGDRDVVARVKSDYRETLDEMLLEHLLRPLTAWAHERGSLSRNQAHGSPGNLLDLYGASDIPETEMFGPMSDSGSDPLISKFASSAAHVAGKRLTSAETGTWLGEHFTVTLDQLKQEVDQLFVSGVNHVIYHGTAYSPRDAAWPGWQFYASTELNPRNAIWRDVPALNQYVARVQSILQSGRPDNDVLLYWPIYDNWHDTTGLRSAFEVQQPGWLHEKPVGAVARVLWQRGYGFDYVSDRLLRTDVSTSEYRAIIVPPTGHMPDETFGRLLDLARAGATVIFVDQLPSDVPGLGRLPERRRRLENAKRRLPLGVADGDGARRSVVGKGRVLVGHDVERLLDAAGVRREGMVDHAGVRFIRRRQAGSRHYFISYTGATPLDGWIPLAVSTAAVAIMDPLSERTGLARLRTGTDGRAELYLQLEPGASIILRSFDHPVAGVPWRYGRAVGAGVELRGNWSVTFLAGGPVLPTSFRTDTLVSWTERGDEEARRFAGTARYSIRFDAPGEASSYLLDLGRVAESARVRLNGKELGILFARPFRVETGLLRPTGNELEIEVTNLSANRIRDLDVRRVPWKVFEDINFVGIDYKPFDASGWPLKPSGLLGPVRLEPLASQDR